MNNKKLKIVPGTISRLKGHDQKPMQSNSTYFSSHHNKTFNDYHRNIDVDPWILYPIRIRFGFGFD